MNIVNVFTVVLQYLTALQNVERLSTECYKISQPERIYLRYFNHYYKMNLLYKIYKVKLRV